MTERELYDGVIVEGTTDLFYVVDLLQRHHAAWCLIGGLAINAYVAPVYTADCDLVVVAAGLEAVLADLKAADFRIKRFPFSINAQRRLKPGEKSTHRLMVQFTATRLFLAWMDKHRLGRKRLLDAQLAATYRRAGLTSILTTNPSDFEVLGEFTCLVPANEATVGE